MIIFDEKIYSQNVLRNGYQTKKNQGVERCSLIRYLRNEGKTDDEIILELDKIPFEERKFLSRKDILKIYEKLLKKASDFEYMADIKVSISKSEMDKILNLDDDVQFLAFVYLVYFKWAQNSFNLTFNYNDKRYAIYKENDLWKLANLLKIRVRDRQVLDSKLLQSGFLKIEILKTKPYICVDVDDKDEYQTISGTQYENLYYEFLINKNDKTIIRCQKCGNAFHKIHSSERYCITCKGIIKQEKNNTKVKKNREGTYTVYKHISPSGKVYIGITSQDPQIRWNNGNGYKNNIHFNNAINKYGWENFEHIIINEGISYSEAAKEERKLIKLYDSRNPEKGYNVSEGGDFGKSSPWCEDGTFINNIEQKRKIINNLIKSGRKPRKIYQPIAISELEPFISSEYFNKEPNIFILYVYYVFMRDMNKVLEDGYVYVYDDYYFYSRIIKLLKVIEKKYKKTNILFIKKYNDNYYFKVKLGERKEDYNNDNSLFLYDFPNNSMIKVLYSKSTRVTSLENKQPL